MSRFIGDKPTGTFSFVQWKGTDVCMDFNCECGWGGHFDGDFAYVVKCGGCGRLWEAPCYIEYRPNERDDGDRFVEPE